MITTDQTILIIDDMALMRKIVQDACKSVGYNHLMEAEDGDKAWEILQNTEVGLIISDWNMPNCSGMELLGRVREDQKTKSIPFMMVTAEAEIHNVKQALLGGVDGYIVKPFSPDVLIKKIEEINSKLKEKKSA